MRENTFGIEARRELFLRVVKNNRWNFRLSAAQLGVEVETLKTWLPDALGCDNKSHEVQRPGLVMLDKVS